MTTPAEIAKQVHELEVTLKRQKTEAKTVVGRLEKITKALSELNAALETLYTNRKSMKAAPVVSMKEYQQIEPLATELRKQREALESTVLKLKARKKELIGIIRKVDALLADARAELATTGRLLHLRGSNDNSRKN